MKTLNPYKIPLESINLIEASAGTGKSWTVTLLYLRLILEKNLTVEQILVVTFTEAATKELRDDVRNRLSEALAAFENPDADGIEDAYNILAKKISASDDLSMDEAIRRLKRAKLSLDEAAIFTIHGFCQRALSEHAFEAGLAFESELMDDDFELMQQLADDYWRRNFQHAPRALLFKLQQASITPDSLLSDIRVAVGKPYLELYGPPSNGIEPKKWAELEALFAIVLKSWKEQGESIRHLLTNPDHEKDFYVDLIKNREFIFSEMGKIMSDKCLPCSLDSKKMSWLGTRPKIKKTAKSDDIEHPFFQKWQDFLDLWNALQEGADNFVHQIHVDLLKYLQQELPKEKQRRGVLSFDDLLLQLQQALQDHAHLAAALCNKYPAALIDEFQDTDPIQYDIFSRIYNASEKSTVFFVGDPKQAIYSFRGGDIYTYLKAKSGTDESRHATLKTNWRSHPKLIAAFNALYGASDNPFQDDNIDYVQVKAGLKDDQGIAGKADKTPLRFWQFNPETDDKGAVIGGMDAIKRAIAEAVAGDITQLLNSDTTINGKPVSGADIAILVRSHTQGDLIKAALNVRGIASVQSSNESIFETHEAVEMQRLLTAIIEPQQEDNVRRALVTDMLGYQSDDLIRFENDPDEWEGKLVAMQNWHQRWMQDGFLLMMRSLMRDESVHQRLLAYDDGERRITNLLQLAELIHRATRQQSLGMEEVLRWLRQQQQNASLKEAELRLESDENLVKIVTIHKSKGLEYPVVYCPFVGLNGAPFKGKVFTFYDDGQPCLEIGSVDFDAHKNIKIREEQAEATRLLYVALTRAKYQCTVVCLPEPVYKSPDKTALGWLITNGKTTAITKDRKPFHEAYRHNLDKLVFKNKGIISLDDLPAFPANLRYQAKQTDSDLSARKFTARIKEQAQITSFSGLTAGAHAETPDYDAQSRVPLIDLPSIENEFPRGAAAGIALHEIYENLDFTQPVSEQQNTVLNALNKWGFDSKHQDAASLLIENSLHAELFDGFALNQLSHHKRLNEMEFYLPLKRLQIDDLKQILFKLLPADQQVIRDAVNTLDFDQVQGYMKGFIDLIFEHQGKYYLADYKSNSLTDYQRQSLLPVMADAHYYLQYLLYSVALHRYLKKRLTDYRWEKDMGGVYYLFIRGMGEESQNGIFFDKPSLPLIEALDALFVREVAHA